MQSFIIINKKDNVAVALRDLEKGETIEIPDGEGGICTLCPAGDIPRGHKFACRDIAEAENVIKYGYPIGHARANIKAGEHVHIHNLVTNLGDDVEYSYCPIFEKNGQRESMVTDVGCGAENPKSVAGRNIAESGCSAAVNGEAPLFWGYERADGRVGIRNELWIIPTVGCVNSVAKAVEARCRGLAGNGIDAVVAFNHPYGCSQMGDDQENTREALAALIKHPNAGGVLVLGLGCENSNIGVLKDYLGDYDREHIYFLNCQDEEDEVSRAVELMEKLAAKASAMKRTEISADRLIIGMKCGGSDGLSGITANPTVGRLSDIVTGWGGSTILTEVPEMFGAETILMNRAENKAVFDKTVNLIQDFKEYYRKNGQTIYENPSPGNKAGGISTLEDKALGCTQKSGSAVVKDVLKYAERLSVNGLNLLSAPGNDLVAATALALSGAQMILFTTGRGTPFAAAVPTIKISSNSPLAEKKRGWIDFDCGVLLNDGQDIDELGKKLFEYCLRVASGEKVKSELEGFRDLAVFKTGVTL